MLQLIPMDRDGRLRQSETLNVVGKDLSTIGVAFSHGSPLRHPRGILSLNYRKPGGINVEIEVRWSRLTPIGLYESGCRMVRKLSAPELQA
jgi:hypothetical protein